MLAVIGCEVLSLQPYSWRDATLASSFRGLKMQPPCRCKWT